MFQSISVICVLVFSFYFSLCQAYGDEVLLESGYKIKRNDTSCDGFPRVQVNTAEGLCLGMVLSREAFADQVQRGKFIPRNIKQIPGTEDFLLTDMGGWWPKDSGRVWRLQKTESGYKPIVLFRRLVQAHGLQFGPDGKAYIGEAHQIFRFDVHAQNPRKELVITGLPSSLKTKNIHPLSEFIFDQNNDIIVNVGAPSDNCKRSLTSNLTCKESDVAPRQASLRRYPYLGNASWSNDYGIEARGLRNSIALAIHRSGTIIQAENGHDFASESEPYDELNIIHKGKHYGWPYCYNFRATVDRWRNSRLFLCQPERNQSYAEPYVLLPPHSAPLDLLYIDQHRSPFLSDKLLLVLHGNQPAGNRIIAFPVDNTGKPQLSSSATYSTSVAGSNRQRTAAYRPTGGSPRFAQHTEVVHSWSALQNVRPVGRPTSIASASDGSLWISEDKNGTILRLALSKNSGSIEDGDAAVARAIRLAVERVQTLPGLNEKYRQLQDTVLNRRCASCHGGLQESPEIAPSGYAALEFLVRQGDWLPDPNNTANVGKLWVRVNGLNGTRRMPLGRPLNANELSIIKAFLDQYK